MATEIASAIEYLHGKRMIYRDLKAGNVGITASGHVQLFDFGLCRFLPEESLAFKDDTYKMSGKVGTYRFMAPEIADAKPYNELADTYSYVHLLYQILALQKPYPTLSKEEHRERVIEGGERPPIDSQWPQKIQELLFKGWSAEISDRPSMSEVVAILKDVIADLDQDKSLSIVKSMSDVSVLSTAKTVKSGQTSSLLPRRLRAKSQRSQTRRTLLHRLRCPWSFPLPGGNLDLWKELFLSLVNEQNPF